MRCLVLPRSRSACSLSPLGCGGDGPREETNGQTAGATQVTAIPLDPDTGTGSTAGTGTPTEATATAGSQCEAAKLLESSEGCEYYAVKSELIAAANGSCFAAFVANTSEQPAELSVEYDGQVLPVANFTRIPQGQGAAIRSINDVVVLPQ